MAALAAVGATGGVAVSVRRAGDRRTGGAGDDPGDGSATGEGTTADVADETTVRSSMAAVARVVYPGEVSGVDSFVGRFLDGRLDGSSHARGIRGTVAELDGLARSWYDAPVADLPPADRDALLREAGADTAEADPDGTTAERVRYYVVNELLLALYASPTGGELVGIENPQGHPGGTESYRQGPR